MSPRQRIRAREVRAPDEYDTLRTDQQVRQYPDNPGLAGRDLQDHLGYTASRIRLNAGALDWRQGPAGGTGTGGGTAQVSEALSGERDGSNRAFTTSQHFVPQSLRLYVNGMRQVFAADGSADFSISESAGAGTGYDRIVMAWAPLGRDALIADYQQAAVEPP